MQLWSVKTDWGSTREPSMKNKLKLLMQSWSFRPVGHLKFGPRAHVNHQQEMLRTILMWPWSMGREILKPPRLWCRFFCQSDFKGGVWRLIAAVQQPDKSWGSQMNVFLSEYNIFDVWFDLSDYKKMATLGNRVKETAPDALRKTRILPLGQPKSNLENLG